MSRINSVHAGRRRSGSARLHPLLLSAVLIAAGLWACPAAAPGQDPPVVAPPAPAQPVETPDPTKVGEQIAEKLTEAQRIVDRLKNTPSYQWAEQLKKAQALVAEALQLAPDSEMAKELDAKLTKLLPATQKEYELLVAEAQWPLHIEDFKGDPHQLAEAALKTMGELAQWKHRRPVAVAIRGNWEPRDQLSDAVVVQWALPVLVAFQLEEGGDTCRVYPVLMLTERSQSSKRAAKSPPFKSAEVDGDAFDIKTENVQMQSKNQRDLMWLLLSLANLVGGLLLMGPWLRKSVPGLGALTAVLEPAQSGLGVLIMLIGAIRLVGGILSLSLPQSLLPILGALVAGSVLGRDTLPKGFRRALVKPLVAGGDGPMRGTMTTAEKTTHDLPDAEQQAADIADETVTGEPEEDVKIVRGEGSTVQDLLDALAGRQVHIGVICFFLGLVHLAFPGAYLF